MTTQSNKTAAAVNTGLNSQKKVTVHKVAILPLHKEANTDNRPDTERFLQNLNAGVLDYIFYLSGGYESLYMKLEEIELSFTSMHYECADPESVIETLFVLKMVKQLFKPTPNNLEHEHSGIGTVIEPIESLGEFSAKISNY